MGSFDHDSYFLPRTHNETHIFIHDLNYIMEHKYSHSSHDEDVSLRVPPLQVYKLSSEFEKLETWLAQEDQNPNSFFCIEAFKNNVNNDDNNLSMLHRISHLFNAHAKSLIECV